MSRASLAALILAGGLLISSSQARAEDPSLVILLRPPGADRIVREATTRLEAELRAAGFGVRVVEGTAGADGRAQVEGTEGAPRARSFATIALLSTDRGAAADVWVADHITHKTLVRRLDVGDPGLENAASDLAIRSVELLRASLLEVSAPRKKELPADLARWLGDAPAPQPPPSQPAVEPPAPAPTASVHPASPPPAASPVAPHAAPRASPSPVRASVEAGIGLLASPSFGAAVTPVLRLALALPLHLGVRATLVPLANTEITAAAGTVALRQQAVMLELTYAFGLEGGTVFPVVGLGAGFYRLRVDGTARTPYIGEHHDLGAGFVSAGAGLGVRLREGVALLLDGSALVLQPEPVVTVLDKTVGSTGRPAFLVSGGLSMGL